MAEEAVVFGSKEWFQIAKQKLSTDEDLKKGAATWQGAMRCVIDAEDENAVKEYTTEDGIKAILGMFSLLSVEERVKYKGTGLANLVEKLGVALDEDLEAVDAAEVAKKAASMTIDDFKGAVIYASFEPYMGELRQMDPIAPDALLDAPFTLTGKFTWWKELCTGKQSAIQLIMGGKMQLDGDITYIMKRMAAVNALMKVYNSIPLK